MSVRRAASQLLPARSVHLKIVPRPANLAEGREIFRVLQQFGDISVFKSLRYEYHNPADNIALAIFRDAASAQRALDASPIRFALKKDTHSPNEHESSDAANEHHDEDHDDAIADPSPPTKTGIDEVLRPSALLICTEPTIAEQPTPPAPEPTPMPFEPPTPSPDTHSRTKWFQVTVDRSRVLHQDYVERQPFWKYFSPMKSMAQEDLAGCVPHVGLSDVSKRPPNAHRTPNKVLKKMSEYVENAMPSLRGMAENSEAERRFNSRNKLRNNDDG